MWQAVGRDGVVSDEGMEWFQEEEMNPSRRSDCSGNQDLVDRIVG